MNFQFLPLCVPTQLQIAFQKPTPGNPELSLSFPLSSLPLFARLMISCSIFSSFSFLFVVVSADGACKSSRFHARRICSATARTEFTSVCSLFFLVVNYALTGLPKHFMLVAFVRFDAIRAIRMFYPSYFARPMEINHPVNKFIHLRIDVSGIRHCGLLF